MAEHKVPQDIEAEDKILGPFSFRQFIYLIIAAVAAAVAFALGRLLLPLAVIPVPVAILFLILALPLRKDQPMETYLAAMIRFLFTPRVRLWNPDGTDNMVEITNPRIDDDPVGRKIKGNDAINRLSLLSDIEDSRGWVTQGTVNNTSVNDELLASVNQTADVMDDSSVADQFNHLLAQSDQNTRSAAVATMNNVRANSSSNSTTGTLDEAEAAALLARQKETGAISVNNIHEKVIQPITSVTTPSLPPTPPPLSRVASPPLTQAPVATPVTTPPPTTNSQTSSPAAPAITSTPVDKPVTPVIMDDGKIGDQAKSVRHQPANAPVEGYDEFEVDLH